MPRPLVFEIDAVDKSSQDLIKIGKNAGDLEQKIEALSKKKAHIGADISDVQRKLHLVETEIKEATGDRKVELEADAEKLKRELSKLKDQQIDVEIKSDQAEGKLRSLKDDVENIGKKKPEIDANPGKAMAKVALIGGALIEGLAKAAEAGMELVGEAIDQGKVSAKLGAQLGLGKEQAAKLGKQTGEIYSDNFGDSFEQVAEAQKLVFQNIGDGSKKWAEQTTKDVLTVANTFDQDLGGTTAAVGQLLRTGLAKDSKEALDILTVGFQNGADKAGDLLDTFNEYGTQFRKVGIDGKTMTGLLVQGLQAGARDSDKVADAIGEFSKRAADGSKTTADGFKKLGLSGKKMAQDIAGGGPKAAKALDLTLDKLRAIKDPVKQSQVAVELFGTQFEDLGQALFALDPSTAAKGMGDFDGAMKKVTETMSDNAGAKISRVWREIKEGAVQGIGTAIGWLEKFSNRVGPIFDQAVTVIGPFVQEMGEKLMPKLRELWQVIDTEVVPAVVGWYKAMIPIAVWLGKTLLPVVTTVFGSMIDIIRGAFKIIAGVFTVFTAILTGDWGKAWSGIKKILSGAWTIIVALIRGAFAIVKGTFLTVGKYLQVIWSRAWSALGSVLKRQWNTMLSILKLGVKILKDYVWDPIKRQIDNAGKFFSTGVQAIGKAWNKVKEIAAKPVRFVINTVLGGIVGKFNSLAKHFPGVPTLPVPHVSFAGGGRVHGEGGDTADKVPVMASNNEWIIRARAARRLGAKAMHMINNADRLDVSGDIAEALVRRRYASGGEVTAGQIARAIPTRAWLPSVDPLPYRWGGVGPSAYDCSGLVGEVWARLTGHQSYRRYMTTATIRSSPSSLGLAKGPGLFTIGVSDTHTAGNLGGLGFEAASTKSGIHVGSSAKSVGSFPQVFHLASLGGGGDGGGGGGSWWNPLDWVKAGTKKAVNALTGAWFGKLHKMGFLGDLGIGLTKKIMGGIFDRGGVLRPGLTLAYNGTGLPERVSPPGSESSVTINVNVHNAVIGNERELSRVVTRAVRSAVETGTLKFDATRRRVS